MARLGAADIASLKGLRVAKATDLFRVKKGRRSTENNFGPEKRGLGVSDVEWYPFGVSEKVYRFTLGGGLYIDDLSDIRGKGYSLPRGVIDTSLPVEEYDKYRHFGNVKRYWATYEDLQPHERYLYLSFLSDGACDPLAPETFVFMYFYGLERRAFLDASLQDLPDIKSEIQRLLEIYSIRKSIVKYFTAALSYIELMGLVDGDLSADTVTQMIDERGLVTSSLKDKFKVALGALIKSEQPVPAQALYALYFSVIASDKDALMARNSPELFRPVFMDEFKKMPPLPAGCFNEGVPLGLKYKAASSDFDVSLDDVFKDLPDISSSTQFNFAIDQVNGAVHKILKPFYERYRVDNFELTIMSWAELPAVLRERFRSKLDNLSLEWLDTVVDREVSLVEAGEFFVGRKMSATSTLMDRVADTAGKCGLSMFPKSNELPKPVKEDMHIMFYETSDVDEELSEQVVDAFMVAVDMYKAAEVDMLTDLVYLTGAFKALFKLNKHRVTRLLFAIDMMDLYEVSRATLTRRIKKFDDTVVQALQSVLLHLSKISKMPSVESVKVVETYYKYFGLEVGSVYSDIHNYSEIKTDATVVDGAKLETIKTSTKKAAGILSEVFSDDLDEDPDDIEDRVDVKDNGADVSEGSASDEELAFDGLSKEQGLLLTTLLTKEEWQITEYEALAKEYGFIPSAVMETLNDWSYDRFDEPIIEEDDVIYVYPELIE